MAMALRSCFLSVLVSLSVLFAVRVGGSDIEANILADADCEGPRGTPADGTASAAWSGPADVECQAAALYPLAAGSASQGSRYMALRPSTMPSSSGPVAIIEQTASFGDSVLPLVRAGRIGVRLSALIGNASAVVLQFVRQGPGQGALILGQTALEANATALHHVLNASSSNPNRHSLVASAVRTLCVPELATGVTVRLLLGDVPSSAVDDVRVVVFDISSTRAVPAALTAVPVADATTGNEPTATLLSGGDGGELADMSDPLIVSCLGWFASDPQTPIVVADAAGFSTTSSATWPAPSLGQKFFRGADGVTAAAGASGMLPVSSLERRLSRTIDIGPLQDRNVLTAYFRASLGNATSGSVGPCLTIEAFEHDGNVDGPAGLGGTPNGGAIAVESLCLTTATALQPPPGTLLDVGTVLCVFSSVRWLRVNVTVPAPGNLLDNARLWFVAEEVPGFGANLIRDGSFEGRCWPPSVAVLQYDAVAADTSNAALQFSPLRGAGDAYAAFNTSFASSTFANLTTDVNGTVVVNVTRRTTSATVLVSLLPSQVQQDMLPFLNDHASPTRLTEENADLELAVSFGGVTDGTDAVAAVFTVEDAGGALLTSYSLGPVTFADRQNRSTFARLRLDQCVRSTNGYDFPLHAAPARINVTLVCTMVRDLYTTHNAYGRVPGDPSICEGLVDDVRVAVVRQRAPSSRPLAASEVDAASPLRSRAHSGNLLANPTLEQFPTTLGPAWSTSLGRITFYAVPSPESNAPANPDVWSSTTRVVSETRPPCSSQAIVNDFNGPLQVLQTVDLCDYAPWISTGEATVTATAWIGGRQADDGSAEMALSLYTFGQDRVQLGDTVVASSHPPNRSGIPGTQLTRIEHLAVPANARSVVLVLTAQLHGLIDDVTLVLYAPPGFLPSLSSPVDSAVVPATVNALRPAGISFETPTTTGGSSGIGSGDSSGVAVTWLGSFTRQQYVQSSPPPLGQLVAPSNVSGSWYAVARVDGSDPDRAAVQAIVRLERAAMAVAAGDQRITIGAHVGGFGRLLLRALSAAGAELVRRQLVAEPCNAAAGELRWLSATLVLPPQSVSVSVEVRPPAPDVGFDGETAPPRAGDFLFDDPVLLMDPPFAELTALPPTPAPTPRPPPTPAPLVEPRGTPTATPLPPTPTGTLSHATASASLSKSRPGSGSESLSEPSVSRSARTRSDSSAKETLSASEAVTTTPTIPLAPITEDAPEGLVDAATASTTFAALVVVPATLLAGPAGAVAHLQLLGMTARPSCSRTRDNGRRQGVLNALAAATEGTLDRLLSPASIGGSRLLGVIGLAFFPALVHATVFALFHFTRNDKTRAEAMAAIRFPRLTLAWIGAWRLGLLLFGLRAMFDPGMHPSVHRPEWETTRESVDRTEATAAPAEVASRAPHGIELTAAVLTLVFFVVVDFVCPVVLVSLARRSLCQPSSALDGADAMAALMHDDDDDVDDDDDGSDIEGVNLNAPPAVTPEAPKSLLYVRYPPSALDAVKPGFLRRSVRPLLPKHAWCPPECSHGAIGPGWSGVMGCWRGAEAGALVRCTVFGVLVLIVCVLVALPVSPTSRGACVFQHVMLGCVLLAMVVVAAAVRPFRRRVDNVATGLTCGIAATMTFAVSAADDGQPTALVLLLVACVALIPVACVAATLAAIEWRVLEPALLDLLRTKRAPGATEATGGHGSENDTDADDVHVDKGPLQLGGFVPSAAQSGSDGNSIGSDRSRSSSSAGSSVASSNNTFASINARDPRPAQQRQREQAAALRQLLFLPNPEDEDGPIAIDESKLGTEIGTGYADGWENGVMAAREGRLRRRAKKRAKYAVEAARGDVVWLDADGNPGMPPPLHARPRRLQEHDTMGTPQAATKAPAPPAPPAYPEISSAITAMRQRAPPPPPNKVAVEGSGAAAPSRIIRPPPDVAPPPGLKPPPRRSGGTSALAGHRALLHAQPPSNPLLGGGSTGAGGPAAPPREQPPHRPRRTDSL